VSVYDFVREILCVCNFEKERDSVCIIWRER